ncbi:MAG: amidase domain-containing protein [Oscillospiraceae bacterium]|jgi:hypothetical protein|nr:amidase domain-containing protein [Oscillospiraceae bacterium]
MPYNPQNAVAYAHRWAHGRNTRFYNFTGQGGDCTNFISQCLYAGCGVMDYRRDAGWYYRNLNDRAPAWTSVEHLFRYLTRTADTAGPRGTVVGLGEVSVGDVIQLSFDNSTFGHSLLIVERSDSGIRVATHTDDSDYRQLETYSFAKLRAIRIK